MNNKVNNANHCAALASVVEAFLWAHSGGDDGRLLPDICKQAVQVLEEYNKSLKPHRVPLKALMALAYQDAVEHGRDPWGEVLKEVGYHAKRWEDHATDDKAIYEDIAQWLEYEATLEAGE